MAVSEQTLATGKQLDALCINTIRTLAMDAVQKANSGHPGAPMAWLPLPIAYGSSFCGMTQPIQCGPIAIASCFPMATLPCFFTPCSTSRRCAA